MAKWGEQEKEDWLSGQRIRRSYADEVRARLKPLGELYRVQQYGALSIDPERYPMYILITQNWQQGKPATLITGGVHGYETSGVHGALGALEEVVEEYSEQFNIAVAPCVSPWGYETINRWNPRALDPNRSFYPDSPAEESAALMQAVASLNTPWLMHIDLHETTDTDNTVFRPALAARDGVEFEDWGIPDGFYTVGCTERPADGFQRAIIDAVRKVTHIAPADEDGCIIGEKVTQPGVINYDTRRLFLCTGFSDATYCTTTEVYPDSPKTSPEECTRAQVAAVRAGFEYLLR